MVLLAATFLVVYTITITLMVLYTTIALVVLLFAILVYWISRVGSSHLLITMGILGVGLRLSCFPRLPCCIYLHKMRWEESKEIRDLARIMYEGFEGSIKRWRCFLDQVKFKSSVVKQLLHLFWVSPEAHKLLVAIVVISLSGV